MTARVGGAKVLPMPTPLRSAISQYLRANIRASTTRKEYQTTLTKWSEWGNGVPIEQLGRREVREFLDWVYERAISDQGTNPGRTANKARDHLRAIIAWAWEQDLIDSFPRFPKPKAQRDVRGRYYRPMNRAVHAHIKSIMPLNPQSDESVFLGGSARPNARFQYLCQLAGIAPKKNSETGADEPWELKDLRKTCATYHDEHIPESSVEILGHSVAGVTYRHYAHRAPLAFRAITTLPQPSAFSALLSGNDENCPCCRRRFEDAR